MRTLLSKLLLAIALPFALPLAHATDGANEVGTFIPSGAASDELAQRLAQGNAVVIASIEWPVYEMCNPDRLPPNGARIQELTFVDDHGETLRIRAAKVDADREAQLAALKAKLAAGWVAALAHQTSALTYIPVAYVVPSGRYRLHSHTLEAGMIARRAPAKGWSKGSPQVDAARGLPRNGTFVAPPGKTVYIGHFYVACGVGAKTLPFLDTDNFANEPYFRQSVREAYPGLNLESLVGASVGPFYK